MVHPLPGPQYDVTMPALMACCGDGPLAARAWEFFRELYRSGLTESDRAIEDRLSWCFVLAGRGGMTGSERECRAESIAAYYDFDVDKLHFEYSRRCFGSFTTTIAGFADRRALYRRAWEIAVHRQANTVRTLEAAE